MEVLPPAGLAGKSLCSSQEETYELPDGNITTVGAIRLRCAGMLFQPSLTSQMIMKRDVDIREDVYANVVLSSGTTIFQRIGTVDCAPSTMSFKVVASPERKC